MLGERFLATSLTAFGRIADPRLATAARKCVDAADMGPVRSGEFVIGGRLGAAQAPGGGRGRKIWWAPLHQAPEMAPLVVRGRNLSASRDTLVFSQSVIASPGVPATHTVLPEYFFPSMVMIPTAGRWLLIATSGVNWGCFRLTVQ